MGFSVRACGAVVASACMFLSEGTAAAQGSSSAGADVATRSASKRFTDGKEAFGAGDYFRAGIAFEEAYAIAPHEAATWNAACSWHRAGEIVRAANLYARYVREAPPRASDRATAILALTQLGPRVGRLEVHAPSDMDIFLDGARISVGTVFVTPGSHHLRGRRDERVQEQNISVDAGAIVSTTLDVEPATPKPSPDVPASPTAASPDVPASPTAASPTPNPPRGRRPSHGWSPTVFWVEGAVTLAALGVATWSSLDTSSARTDFDRSPTREGLDEGRSRMLRTNVAWGVVGGLAAITTLTGLLLVDWRGGHGAVDARLGPGWIGAEARF